jgi:hypothetical protein
VSDDRDNDQDDDSIVKETETSCERSNFKNDKIERTDSIADPKKTTFFSVKLVCLLHK